MTSNKEFPMSHSYIKFTTDGKTWRELKDTSNTDAYINKLSHAAVVLVTFATGEWLEYECGSIINSGY